MILEIRARFECDDCGMRFSVGLDPAHVPAPGASIFEVAEEAVRKMILGDDCPDEMEEWT